MLSTIRWIWWIVECLLRKPDRESGKIIDENNVRAIAIIFRSVDVSGISY